VAFSASFILFEKIRRSSSMSEKPAGGALRFDAWRIAGMVSVSVEGVGGSRILVLGGFEEVVDLLWFWGCGGV
jgi:hypothetical protein